MKIQNTMKMGGRGKARVLRADGSVKSETPWKSNLILNPGIQRLYDASSRFEASIGQCVAGTGTSPTKSSLDGTFAQAGTTVTRSTGTGTFSVGDVGNHLKFGTGEEVRIVSFTSATQVEVREDLTVAATTLEKYETETNALDAQVNFTTTLDGSPGANETSTSILDGTLYIKRTFNFGTEVGTVNYNEVGLGGLSGLNLMSRIVFDSTVTVNAGEQLQVVYEVTYTCDTYLLSVPETIEVTGWPFPYTITGITSTPTDFDVTLSDDHHYEVGDEITIANALPTKADIASLTSTPTEFTVTTTTAHGLAVSDAIEIEGATPAGYNGAWTVAAVDSTTVFRVTSAINPGVGSGGTARKATPGTWYDGTWTIASFPASNIIRVTSAINPIDAGEGELAGTLAGDAQFYGFSTNEVPFGFSGGNGIADPLNSTSYNCGVARSGNENTPLGLGQGYFLGGDDVATRSKVRNPYDSDDQSFSREFEFDIDEANFTDIRQFYIQGFSGSSRCAIVFTFDQNQRKDAGYVLKLGYSVRYRQDLP